MVALGSSVGVGSTEGVLLGLALPVAVADGVLVGFEEVLDVGLLLDVPVEGEAGPLVRLGVGSGVASSDGLDDGVDDGLDGLGEGEVWSTSTGRTKA